MENLKVKAYELRKDTVDIIMAGGGGHIGGDMSVMEVLTDLYFHQMNISAENPEDPDRDLFILSKGHSMEAYYAVLCAKGFLDLEDVKNRFSKFGSPYIGHPHNTLPGIEMNSGSLGHGLPVAVGMALACKKDGKNNRVYVVTGDGEMAEGSNWEGFMSGAMYGLDNLCCIIDRNHLQISGNTEDVMALDELPICGVLGDSHGALFGQNCRQPGQIKATYGTGSSVMMNIGEKPLLSEKGIVTSLAWGRKNKVEYVFEGDLNYTGAVISWLKDQVGMIEHAKETGPMAEEANPSDKTYFVPAFTGLGAPYWDSEATGMFTGITRTTGRKEMVKACVECIGYQITDLVELMREETGRKVEELRVDGGPTANTYLMQFQSDMAQAKISIPELQELSGMGTAYMAGIAAGVYDEESIYDHVRRTTYEPRMQSKERENRYEGWKKAVQQVLDH